MPSVVQRAFRRLLRAQPSPFAFDSLLAAAPRSFEMARTLAASSPSIPVTRNPVYVSAVGVPPCQVSARLTLVQAAEDLFVHLARTRPSMKEGETLSYVIDLAYFQRAATHSAAHVMPKDIAEAAQLVTCPSQSPESPAQVLPMGGEMLRPTGPPQAAARAEALAGLCPARPGCRHGSTALASPSATKN